jgi:hypothetical protein
MLDVAVAYNRYRFLGNEFLTWLWWLIEARQDQLKEFDPDLTALEVGNRIDLENRRNEKIERITIKGDDADFKEGYLALRKGALVTDLSLVLRSANFIWQFNIKGESLNVSSLKAPEPVPPENELHAENELLEKIALHERITQFLEAAFRHFVHLRTSDKWGGTTVGQIHQWLSSP